MYVYVYIVDRISLYVCMYIYIWYFYIILNQPWERFHALETRWNWNAVTVAVSRTKWLGWGQKLHEPPIFGGKNTGLMQIFPWFSDDFLWNQWIDKWRSPAPTSWPAPWRKHAPWSHADPPPVGVRFSKPVVCGYRNDLTHIHIPI